MNAIVHDFYFKSEKMNNIFEKCKKNMARFIVVKLEK
jgi:hypothetical protein